MECIKFPVTAFLVTWPECICSVSCTVTILLTQPECLHKSTAGTGRWLFYVLQYSKMPSSVLLLFLMLRIYRHFNRFCRVQPKVLSSLRRSLPDPFPSSTSVSITETQTGPWALRCCTTQRLLRVCTQGQQRYTKHKIGPLGHARRCCWWKTSPASPSGSPQLLQSLHVSGSKLSAQPPGRQNEWEHKAGFSKINAVSASTELSSQSFSQGH